MRTKRLIYIALIAILGVAFTSCRKDNNAPTTVPQPVVDLINNAGLLPEPPPAFDVTTEVLADDGLRCQTVRITAAQNPEEFVMLNPLTNILWPGSLVQGASLASGILQPVLVDPSKRQPGNISLAIVSSAGEPGTPMYRRVESMQFSSVNQAMNDILSGFGGHGFAQYSFSMHHIESAEDLEFRLNARFKGFGATARAGLTANFSESRTRILVRLHQSYFTMAIDIPAGFDAVFTPDITESDLRPFTGPGNPICYISSVTFGRVFYLLYESTASQEALQAALNFTFRGFGVDAGIGAEVETRATLAETIVQVFQLGGDAQGGITAGMAGDLDAIREFLEKGANFSAQNVGAPISYTVRHLKDGSLVRMSNTLEHTIERCVEGGIYYIDASGETGIWLGEITPITNSTRGILSSGWYIVSDMVHIPERITISGDVHIILEDNFRLTVTGGINVPDGNRLTIYAQSTGNNMGELTATAISHNAGIGGDAGQAAGDIVINGGEIRATGSNASLGANGGSANGGNGGAGAGAGIGGGGGSGGSGGTGGNTNCTAGNSGGAGGTVIINGGRVYATGGNFGARGLQGNNGSGGGGGGMGAGIGGGGGGGGGGNSRYGSFLNFSTGNHGVDGSNAENVGTGGNGGNGGRRTGHWHETGVNRPGGSGGNRGSFTHSGGSVTANGVVQ